MIEEHADKLTFFVAGATGYTGRAMVDRICAEGGLVVAHIRPESSQLDRESARIADLGGIPAVCGWREQEISKLLRDHAPAAVFSLLGTTKKSAKEEALRGREASYEKVDYGLSALLLRATRASAPSARFVYLSSLGVKPGVKNAYLAARARFEKELEDSGQPYVIVRPSFISGEDRRETRPMERIGATLTDGALSTLAALGARKMQRRYQSIDAAGLAQRLWLAATEPQFLNRVLEPDAF